jgi:cytochrome b involved in lipid metabolism
MIPIFLLFFLSRVLSSNVPSSLLLEDDACLSESPEQACTLHALQTYSQQRDRGSKIKAESLSHTSLKGEVAIGRAQRSLSSTNKALVQKLNFSNQDSNATEESRNVTKAVFGLQTNVSSSSNPPLVPNWMADSPSFQELWSIRETIGGWVSLLSSHMTLSLLSSRIAPPESPEDLRNYQQNFCFGAVIITVLPFLIVMIEDGKGKKRSSSEQARQQTSMKVTLKELKEHNTASSLWLSIDGVVCDVTDFMMLHPGGPDVLLNHGGTEAIDVFQEVGHSEFALNMVQTRAIGLLVDGDAAPRTGALGAAGATTLLGRLFTKEDSYNLHKVLGFFVLFHVAYRMIAVLCLVPSAGFDTSWTSLALVWVCALLQVSSFRFEVPRARLLGSPMIWQEWRAHNLVFVMRHILGFTVNWVLVKWLHKNIFAWSMIETVLIAVLYWQLYTVDVITAYIREDKHTSLTASWPFWEGCPIWLEKAFKFYYTIAQFQASSLLIFAGGDLYINFLVIFPFQFASFLMTLVRKGIITTKGFHAGYLWSLWMVVWLAIGPDYQTWFGSGMFWIFLYTFRFWGLSKYGLWFGPLVATVGQNLLLVFPKGYSYKFAVMLAVWVIWMVLQQLVMGFAFETRARRFLESRVKPLVLLKREKVNDTLYLLKLQIPIGYSSGVNPGQHVKIHAPNKSMGSKTWNTAPNLEEPAEELSRSYTPISCTTSTTMDLLVRHYPKDPDRGFPDGGRASTYLIQEAAIGSELWMTGPHGHQIYLGQGLFLVGKETVKARFCGALAGGSGITPVLAVLQDIWQEGRRNITDRDQRILGEQAVKMKGFSVLHVTRTAGEALPSRFYTPPGRKLNASSGGSTTASDEDGEDEPTPCSFTHLVTGGDKSSAGKQLPVLYGKLTEDKVKNTLPGPGDDVVILVCGPLGFVENVCRPILRSLGYKHVIVLQ